MSPCIQKLPTKKFYSFDTISPMAICVKMFSLQIFLYKGELEPDSKLTVFVPSLYTLTTVHLDSCNGIICEGVWEKEPI